MDNTYTILDRDHWKIMQLDPDKTYRTSSRFNVFQFGKGIMLDYLIRRKLDDDFITKVLWGTQQADRRST